MKIVKEIIELSLKNDEILKKVHSNGEAIENLDKFDLSKYHEKVKIFFEEISKKYDDEDYIDNLISNIEKKYRLKLLDILIEQIMKLDQFTKNNITNKKFIKDDKKTNTLGQKLFSKFIRKRGGSYKHRDTSDHIYRESYEYTQILDFKEYEFTHNIAFLFAKRSIVTLFGSEIAYKKRLYNQLLFLNEQIDMTTNNIYDEDKYIAYISDDNMFKQMILILFEDNNIESLVKNSFLCENKQFSVDEKMALTRSVIDVEIFNEDNTPDQNFYKYKKTIHPKFLFPTVGYKMTTYYNIDLNLSLPDDELVKYIKHVKSSILKDEKPVILREIFNAKNPTIEYVLGDILYIYDAVKIGMTYDEIMDSIDEYREIVGLDHISDGSIKRYLKYAKFFIEEKNYYSLVDCSFRFDFEGFYKIKNKKWHAR